MTTAQRFEDPELYASLEIFLEKLSEDLFTHLPDEVLPRRELLMKEDENLRTIYETDYQELMKIHRDTWSEYSEYSHCVEAFLGSSVYTEDSLLGILSEVNSRGHIGQVVIPRLFAEYFKQKGDLKFDENLFVEVYDEFEEYLQNDSVQYRSWALLSNFHMETEELVLEDQLRIRKVTPEERAAVKDGVARGTLTRFDLMNDFLIETEFEISKNPDGPVELNEGEEKFDAVMLALRLFSEGGDTHHKSVFTNEHPVNFSSIGTKTSGGETANGALNERCQFDEENAREFEEFWNNYKSYFYLEERNSITNPIRRFNQMDQKSILEDALIDSVIAFESTLLQEIGQTESYRFRMPLRASLLLEKSTGRNRDFIYQFFRELYDARSAIVHRGSEISSIEIEDQNLNPKEFISQAREFLRHTLTEYIHRLENGESMQQVNQRLDRALRDAEFKQDSEEEN